MVSCYINFQRGNEVKFYYGLVQTRLKKTASFLLSGIDICPSVVTCDIVSFPYISAFTIWWGTGYLTLLEIYLPNHDVKSSYEGYWVKFCIVLVPLQIIISYFLVYVILCFHPLLYYVSFPH